MLEVGALYSQAMLSHIYRKAMMHAQEAAQYGVKNS